MFELSSSLEIGDKPRRIRVCMPPIQPILGMSCFSGPSVVPNASPMAVGKRIDKGLPLYSGANQTRVALVIFT